MATVLETNGGATTSLGYDIELNTAGHSEHLLVGSLYGAIRNPNAYGVNLRWADNYTLHVQYLRARQVGKEIHRALIGNRAVTIVFDSGITDPTAPAGGMLYNAQKTKP